MDELKKWKDSPIWDRGETSWQYGYPLTLDQDFTEAGKRLAAGIPVDEVYRLGRFYAAKSPESHIGPFKWAVDFLVPDDTEVLAAENGIIVDVVDNFVTWGDDPKFRDSLNYITIRHRNGEFSQYCHLAQYSVKERGLKVGDWVSRGRVIGRVGKTGWTDRDHLHFVVLKFEKIEGTPWEYYSLKIRFSEYVEI